MKYHSHSDQSLDGRGPFSPHSINFASQHKKIFIKLTRHRSVAERPAASSRAVRPPRVFLTAIPIPKQSQSRGENRLREPLKALGLAARFDAPIRLALSRLGTPPLNSTEELRAWRIAVLPRRDRHWRKHRRRRRIWRRRLHTACGAGWFRVLRFCNAAGASAAGQKPTAPSRPVGPLIPGADIFAIARSRVALGHGANFVTRGVGLRSGPLCGHRATG
jgi:hypothetical protein